MSSVNWAAVLFLNAILGVFLAGITEEIRDARRKKRRDKRRLDYWWKEIKAE